MGGKRATDLPAVCAVEWCCALAAGVGGITGRMHCAVHVAVPECHPVSDYQPPDYWRELDEAWDAAAADPVLPDTPEREECESCGGDGECSCCEGSGTVDCASTTCRRVHDCDSCDGDGECADCVGTGYEDRKPGDTKKRSPNDLVKRWMENRPSQRKAA